MEDVFLFAWGTDQLTYRAEDLDKIRRWTEREADWARLLQLHHTIRPKPKGKPTFRVVTPEGPANKTTKDLFAGKIVVLFAVPGAFTPTCHKNHLPGFLANADAIKAKGVDAIAVTGVNEAELGAISEPINAAYSPATSAIEETMVADRKPGDPKTWGRIGRNEPCPCGSGKKFKHCHGVLV